MLRRLIAPALLVGASLAALPCYAGGGQQAPNVIVVRVSGEAQGDLTQGGQQGGQQQGLEQEAQLTPLQIDLPMGADGQVDVAQMVQRADQAMQQGQNESFTLQLGDGAAETPQAVQQLFDQADQQSVGPEALAWRFYHRWHGGGGWYGYGHHNWWGYSRFYPSYYPYYGYYSGGLTYPYYYGSYNYAYPYNYYYYYYY